MKKPYTFHEFQSTDYVDSDGDPIHEATYCPEDNKLRLYLGERLGHDEWQTLVQHYGFTWSMKQDCDLVAHWTPARAAICRTLAGAIGDEDQSPAERAAERAERFAGYLEKRRTEAHELADRAEGMDAVQGFQNQDKAEKAAARKQRFNDTACDMWGKAEYWQRRTAGVINSAMYKLRPDVRARRIKKLQADERKHHKAARECRERNRLKYDILTRFAADCSTPIAGMYASNWTACDLFNVEKAEDLPPESIAIVQLYGVLDSYEYGRNTEACKRIESSPTTETAQAVCAELLRKAYPNGKPPEYDENDPGDEWAQHFKLRLAYEQQMLEAETGKLACDLPLIERGGMWKGHVIRNATKNKTSGKYRGIDLLFLNSKNNVEIVRVKFNDTQSADSYEPPTPDSIADQERLWKLYRKQQSAEKASKPAQPKLINLTDEDAERLQESLNSVERFRLGDKPSVTYMTQEQYSAASKSSFGGYETKELVAPGRFPRTKYGYRADARPVVCKVRCRYDSVIVLTDKPQKPAPAELWRDPLPAMAESIRPQWVAFADAVQGAHWSNDIPEEFADVKNKAITLGWYSHQSLSQFGLTETGLDELAKLKEEQHAVQS